MQQPSLARDPEDRAGGSLRLAIAWDIFYPFPVLQRRAHFTAKLFSWFLSRNKTTFVLGRREGKQYKWNCWCRIFLSLFPLQKAARTAVASRRERADSLNKASHKTDLAFQGQTKRKRAGTLLKQWEVSFVRLKAERRLMRHYNFNSFFYFTGLGSSVISQA